MGYNGFGSGFDTMFNIMSFIFPVVFILFLVVFVAIVIRGIAGWNKNNRSPILTVDAVVVAKRGHHRASSGSMHHGAGARGMHGHTSSHTSYYTTFQFDGGDRLELAVPSDQYGYLAEGDRGRLTFQGTRYLSFERDGAPGQA